MVTVRTLDLISYTSYIEIIEEISRERERWGKEMDTSRERKKDVFY